VSISTVGDHDLRRRGKAHNFISRETLTQSTSSATTNTAHDLNNTADQHFLGGGTSTGVFTNSYRLGTVSPVAYEGQLREVFLIATGEAYLNYNNSTATGAWVFTSTDSFMQFKFLAGKWRVLVNSGCTMATQTY
jgi:hypothetical protein